MELYCKGCFLYRAEFKTSPVSLFVFNHHLQKLLTIGRILLILSELFSACQGTADGSP